MIIRSLAGFMAALFLLNPDAGISTWLQVRKAIVKHEVRRHVLSRSGHTGLVLLGFSKPESESLLRWEHPREFEFNGQMYDIVESWTEGDRVYYRCFWDRAETSLNKALRELSLRAFGAAPKFGRDEGFGRATFGSRAFVTAQAWRLRTPSPRLRGRLGDPAAACLSRSVRPPTPPPWTA